MKDNNCIRCKINKSNNILRICKKCCNEIIKDNEIINKLLKEVEEK